MLIWKKKLAFDVIAGTHGHAGTMALAEQARTRRASNP
jgi:hypothetical protein